MQQFNKIQVTNGSWGAPFEALIAELGQQEAEAFLRENHPLAEQLTASHLDWESAVNLLLQKLNWPRASQLLVDNLIQTRRIECPNQCAEYTLTPVFDGSLTLGLGGRLPSPMNLVCSSCSSIIHINSGAVIKTAEHQPHLCLPTD